MAFVTRRHLEQLVDALAAALERPGQLVLVGESSLVWEGWREWADEIEVMVDVDPADDRRMQAMLEQAAEESGAPVASLQPDSVQPLAPGWRRRARAAERRRRGLEVVHFDPVSVAFRAIARGEEEDYRLVLTLLDQAWVGLEEMDALLAELMPELATSAEGCDPEEMRRRYKGLVQMWRSRGGPLG